MDGDRAALRVSPELSNSISSSHMPWLTLYYKLSKVAEPAHTPQELLFRLRLKRHKKQVLPSKQYSLQVSGTATKNFVGAAFCSSELLSSGPPSLTRKTQRNLNPAGWSTHTAPQPSLPGLITPEWVQASPSIKLPTTK